MSLSCWPPVAIIVIPLNNSASAVAREVTLCQAVSPTCMPFYIARDWLAFTCTAACSGPLTTQHAWATARGCKPIVCGTAAMFHSCVCASQVILVSLLHACVCALPVPPTACPDHSCSSMHCPAGCIRCINTTPPVDKTRVTPAGRPLRADE